MGQRQINVETTSCISTLEFTTSSQRCVFQRWCEQRGNNVMKMTISKKKKKKIISNGIKWIQSFNCYFIIFFASLPILRRLCWTILAKPQKLRSWKIFHFKNTFKLLGFVKYQFVFDFTRGLVRSLNMRVTVNLYILNVLEKCNAIL